MMDRTYVLLNMIWILLLGCITYVFGGKILFWLFQKGKGVDAERGSRTQ
jgi:hypothetical protein